MKSLSINTKNQNKTINRLEPIMNQMKKITCHGCKNKMKPIVTTMAFEDNKIILNGVNALSCENCGKQLIDEHEFQKIWDILDKLEKEVQEPSEIRQVIATLN